MERFKRLNLALVLLLASLSSSSLGVTTVSQSALQTLISNYQTALKNFNGLQGIDSLSAQAGVEVALANLQTAVVGNVDNSMVQNTLSSSGLVQYTPGKGVTQQIQDFFTSQQANIDQLSKAAQSVVNNSISTLQTQVRTISSDLDVANGQVSNLTTQLGQTTSQLKTLQDQYSTLETNLNSAKQQVSQLQTQLSAAQKTTGTADNPADDQKISELESELTAAQTAEKDAESKEASDETEIGADQAELSQAQTNLTNETAKEAADQKTITADTAEISQLQTELATAQKAAENTDNPADDQKISDLENELTTEQGEVTAAQAAEKTAESSLATETAKEQADETTISSDESEVAAAQAKDMSDVAAQKQADATQEQLDLAAQQKAEAAQETIDISKAVAAQESTDEAKDTADVAAQQASDQAEVQAAQAAEKIAESNLATETAKEQADETTIGNDASEIAAAQAKDMSDVAAQKQADATQEQLDLAAQQKAEAAQETIDISKALAAQESTDEAKDTADVVAQQKSDAAQEATDISKAVSAQKTSDEQALDDYIKQNATPTDVEIAYQDVIDFYASQTLNVPLTDTAAIAAFDNLVGDYYSAAGANPNLETVLAQAKAHLDEYANLASGGRPNYEDLLKWAGDPAVLNDATGAPLAQPGSPQAVDLIGKAFEAMATGRAGSHVNIDFDQVSQAKLISEIQQVHTADVAQPIVTGSGTEEWASRNTSFEDLANISSTDENSLVSQIEQNIKASNTTESELNTEISALEEDEASAQPADKTKIEAEVAAAEDVEEADPEVFG